jgi:hypothetical protein
MLILRRGIVRAALATFNAKSFCLEITTFLNDHQESSSGQKEDTSGHRAPPARIWFLMVLKVLDRRCCRGGGYFFSYPVDLFRVPDHVINIKAERVPQLEFDEIGNGSADFNLVQTHVPGLIKQA